MSKDLKIGSVVEITIERSSKGPTLGTIIEIDENTKDGYKYKVKQWQTIWCKSEDFRFVCDSGLDKSLIS